jgi:hypothetical protein
MATNNRIADDRQPRTHHENLARSRTSQPRGEAGGLPPAGSGGGAASHRYHVPAGACHNPHRSRPGNLVVVGVNHRDVLGQAATEAADLTIVYLDQSGRQLRRRIDELADVPLEQAPAVRTPVAYRGQPNMPGRWWSATARRHVWYQSWLGRDQAIVLDFDPRVSGLAGQPFRVDWRGAGRQWSHVPAWFARLGEEGALVVDCRPADRIGADEAYRLAVTARACAAAGWRHKVVHGHGRVWMGNLRWLAAYRHPRYLDQRVAAALLLVFAEPGELLAGAEQVGDPIAVLPVLYHLLWRQWLQVDLTSCLHDRTIVHADGAGRGLEVPS